MKDTDASRNGPAGPAGLASAAAKSVRWRPEDGANVTVVSRARTWLRRVLPQVVGRHPRSHLHDDTELLLCELVTNAVLHGGGVTAVRLRSIDKTLRLTVCDHASAPPVARKAADDAETGRGIVLIEALASRWGVERGGPADGKCVWLELPLAQRTTLLRSGMPGGATGSV